MTALLQTRTTIGQLVYKKLPAIDFGRLTADLDAALAGCDAGRIRVALEREGMALLDVGSSRVGIALTRRVDASGAGAVTVTVGFGPDQGGDASLARRRSVLARLIAQRIAARFPPLEMIWTESDEVATPATFEMLRQALAERRAQQAALRAERTRLRRAAPRAGAADGADVSRLFARLDATLDARRAGMGLGEMALAGGAMAMGREAVEVPPPQQSRLRLAAHLLDATLMVIALPVGVAMMIYSLSRGADLHTSARVMAMSGVTIAGLHAMGGAELLSLLGA